MQPELRGRHVVVLVILGAVLAYFVLALRLPQNLAVALASFGACVVGLFIFALRLAFDNSHRHHHD